MSVNFRMIVCVNESVFWIIFLPECLFAVSVVPNLRNMSWPIIFCDLFPTRRIWQFVAFHEPDFRSTWSTLVMFICLLLKHLYFSVFLWFLCLLMFFASYSAKEMFIKDLGEPVSASQWICLLLKKVAINNLPVLSLLIVELHS